MSTTGRATVRQQSIADKKERALELARRYPDLSSTAIAQRLQLSANRVAVWLREAGLARRPGGAGHAD